MQIFPGIDVHFLTLVGHFKLPLVRDYILLHGMLDCSRDTCKRVLTGYDLCPCPYSLYSHYRALDYPSYLPLIIEVLHNLF